MKYALIVWFVVAQWQLKTTEGTASISQPEQYGAYGSRHLCETSQGFRDMTRRYASYHDDSKVTCEPVWLTGTPQKFLKPRSHRVDR